MDIQRPDLIARLSGAAIRRRTVAKAAMVGVLGFEFAGGARRVSAQATPEATPEGVTEMCPTTTTQDNTALARRWYDEAMTGHNLAVLDELLAPGALHRAPSFPDATDPRQVIGAVLTGFPDLQATVDQVLAEGNLVAVRWTISGTHEGEFQGIAPTGQPATWTGMNFFRFGCGRIVEVWNQTDVVGQLAQLGVTELPAPATPTGG